VERAERRRTMVRVEEAVVHAEAEEEAEALDEAPAGEGSAEAGDRQPRGATV
jgi:hypothetical protein